MKHAHCCKANKGQEAKNKTSRAQGTTLDLVDSCNLSTEMYSSSNDH